MTLCVGLGCDTWLNLDLPVPQECCQPFPCHVQPCLISTPVSWSSQQPCTVLDPITAGSHPATPLPWGSINGLNWFWSLSYVCNMSLLPFNLTVPALLWAQQFQMQYPVMTIHFKIKVPLCTCTTFCFFNCLNSFKTICIWKIWFIRTVWNIKSSYDIRYMCCLTI